MVSVTSKFGSWEIQSGFKPRPFDQTTWFITGTSKSGKTSLLASLERCLIVDCEDKARLCMGAKASYFVPTSLPDIDGMVRKLVEVGPSGCPWTRIAFDTADECQSAFLLPGLTAEVRKIKPDFKGDITEWGASDRGSKGWAMMANRFHGWITDLRKAGFGWIIADHIKEDKRSVRSPAGGYVETVRQRASSAPSLHGRLENLAMFRGQTMFVNKTTTTKEVQTIVLPDGSTQNLDVDRKFDGKVAILSVRKGGDLTGGNIPMPERIELPFGSAGEALRLAYDEAVAKGNGHQQETTV